MTFILKSDSFSNMERIPIKYSSEGQGLSPDLWWKGAPEGTKTFCLLMEDPDAHAGILDHWILFNIPSKVASLEAGIKNLPTGSKRGRNSFGELDYKGPSPTSESHKYFFSLYALKTSLTLEEGACKSHLLEAMKKYILDLTVLIGTYENEGI
jgi:Raf kinase inhibitor-like YbhB/YbcL family protein